jgi:hypothetical protein
MSIVGRIEMAEGEGFVNRSAAALMFLRPDNETLSLSLSR